MTDTEHTIRLVPVNPSDGTVNSPEPDGMMLPDAAVRFHPSTSWRDRAHNRASILALLSAK
jgi:hypothetical protein